MFGMFVRPDEGIGLPWQRSEREPSFRRGLMLVGLIVVAGLVLSVLAGRPTPSEQLTILEEAR
jgi:Tfp pilus assembly protein PilN